MRCDICQSEPFELISIQGINKALCQKCYDRLLDLTNKILELDKESYDKIKQEGYKDGYDEGLNDGLNK